MATKHEKRILASLTYMKVLGFIVILVNLIFGRINFLYTIGTVIISIGHFVSTLGGLGYLDRYTAILPIGGTRVFVIFVTLIFKWEFSLLQTVLLVVCDVINIFYLLLHKSKYQYKIVRR